MDTRKIEYMVKEILVEIGEDPEREGLRKTPERIARSLAFLTSGYREDATELIHGATFQQEHNNMVLVRDIELYSLCEHHMLPFYGRCHVGYIPKSRIFGISKIARLVDMYARRIQIQERLTEQIAGTIMETIDPQGVGVVIEAHHLCMMMRGVQKQNSMLITSTVLGTFLSSHPTRAEFLALLERRRP
jgi:GTP cyclohydrolase I